MSENSKPNLPVVSEAILVVHSHDFNHSTNPKEFVVRQFENFRNEQPDLSKYIFDFIEKRADGDVAVYAKMATIALVTYELLSRQAESDAMSKHLDLSFFDQDGE